MGTHLRRYFVVDGPPAEPGGTNWRGRLLVSGEQGLTLDQAEAFLEF